MIIEVEAQDKRNCVITARWWDRNHDECSIEIVLRAESNDEYLKQMIVLIDNHSVAISRKGGNFILADKTAEGE